MDLIELWFTLGRVFKSWFLVLRMAYQFEKESSKEFYTALIGSNVVVPSDILQVSAGGMLSQKKQMKRKASILLNTLGSWYSPTSDVKEKVVTEDRVYLSYYLQEYRMGFMVSTARGFRSAVRGFIDIASPRYIDKSRSKFNYIDFMTDLVVPYLLADNDLKKLARKYLVPLKKNFGSGKSIETMEDFERYVYSISDLFNKNKFFRNRIRFWIKLKKGKSFFTLKVGYRYKLSGSVISYEAIVKRNIMYLTAEASTLCKALYGLTLTQTILCYFDLVIENLLNVVVKEKLTF